MKTDYVFSLTNAYRHLLSFKRVGNDIHTLVAYRMGRNVCVSQDTIAQGTYNFYYAESAYKGYCLFSKMQDYELFLASEAENNKELRQASKSIIDAFDAQYDGKSRPFYKRWYNKWHLNFNTNVEEPVSVHPHEAVSQYAITNKNKEIPFVIKDCKPVFSYGLKQDSKDAIYVYEYSLTKAFHSANKYYSIPCITISLFDDKAAAKEYVKELKESQAKFEKHKTYENAYMYCWFALQRFEKYATINQMKR